MNDHEPYQDHTHYENSVSLYLDQVTNIPLLTREEENELARRVREGDVEAMHRLVRGSLRFVVSIAKRYRGLGLDFLDLINEGNLGLILAARRFDPDKNVRFISYAVWWVKQSIRQGISRQNGAVRLPTDRIKALCRIKDATEELSHKLGREPSVYDLAEEMKLSWGEVEENVSFGREVISLDNPIDEMGMITISDQLVAENAVSAEEVAIGHSEMEELRILIRELSSREREVILHRYGLNGNDPMTLEEIGSRMNLTKERIRQIEKRAKEKLSNLVKSKSMAGLGC